MPALFRATLARRVTVALFAALTLVWFVLLGVQYHDLAVQQDKGNELRDFGLDTLAVLALADDPAQAAATARAIERVVNGGRIRAQLPDLMWVQLWDRRLQRPVYLSPGAPATLLTSEVSGLGWHEADGRRRRVFSADSPRWSLRLLDPGLEPGWLVRFLVGDLTRYMLIALPFVLLPLWLVVRQGLRPLRRLSEHIAARGPDDLSPLGFVPPQAELRPLASALDHLLARLRDKVRHEQALVQDAAHELRTPVAVIAAQAHALANAAEGEERREAERRLDGAIGRVSHLVGQLLQLARIDQATPQGLQTVDLAQLVRGELAELGPAALARGTDLALDAPDTLPHRLDVHAFLSVLHNLLDNAIRYGRGDERREGRIAVDLVREPGRLLLSVADDGPGIAAADRERIFERFHRGAGHDAPGTGLGLAIVKQAAQRLGGTVALTTGLEGRGACFTLALPAP